MPREYLWILAETEAAKLLRGVSPIQRIFPQWIPHQRVRPADVQSNALQRELAGGGHKVSTA